MNRKEFLFLFAARYEPVQITNENMDEVIITLTTTIVVVREFEFWVIVILDIFFQSDDDVSVGDGDFCKLLTPLETGTTVPDSVPKLPNTELTNTELPNTEVTELPNNACAKGRKRSSRSKPSKDVYFERPGLSLVS